jgi:hypothetical protein
LYIYLDQILAKNWKFDCNYTKLEIPTYVYFRHPKVLEQNKRPQTLKV